MATPTPHPPGTLSYQDKGWKLSSIGHVISVCVFESPILFFELFSVVQFFGNRNYFRVSRFFLSVPRPPFVSVSCQSCRCLIYSSNLLSPVNFFFSLTFCIFLFFSFFAFSSFFSMLQFGLYGLKLQKNKQGFFPKFVSQLFGASECKRVN